MEKNWYIVFIVLVVGLICLSFFLLDRKNERRSQDLIAKSKAEKQTLTEAKQQAEQQIEKDEIKEQQDANLEAFVLDMEEERKVESDMEEEFDYKKFVDQNIEDLRKYSNFDDMSAFDEIEEPMKQPPDGFLNSILFGDKISDED